MARTPRERVAHPVVDAVKARIVARRRSRNASAKTRAETTHTDGANESERGNAAPRPSTGRRKRRPRPPGQTCVSTHPRRHRADGGVSRKRPADDRGHQEGRDHSGDGEGAHRPLRRGPGPRGGEDRYIDESEVLHDGRRGNHINKNKFTVPFVCGCRNLGEALRRPRRAVHAQDEGRGRHRERRRWP